MRPEIQLGLRANARQFSILVVVNACVGAMIGTERSIIPAIAEREFHLTARTAVLAFIVIFGVSKALTNYVAGRACARFGCRHALIAGWLVALPVPLLLMWAPSWNWILFANVLLGVSQGLTWSATLMMKIDLAGPSRRGLALGINEFAGYLAVAAGAGATAWIADHYGLRPQPFYLGLAVVASGFALSAFAVRDTSAHLLHDVQTTMNGDERISARDVFWRTSLSDRNLSSVSQAGLVNNLNDGMAWGLFPLVFAAAGLRLAQIGMLASIYPATWGVVQLGTGALSDRFGRKWLIVGGMWTQAIAIAAVAFGGAYRTQVVACVMLGIGTAMVYPTLLAAIGDVARPSWRAPAVGVYRLWRDLGYAIGAVVAGATADALGLRAAVIVIAILTFLSGALVAVRMTETLRRATV